MYIFPFVSFSLYVSLSVTGIFPQDAENHKYVDFSYVGGTQNPRADPVPKGNIQFTLILPNGSYDVRYMYVCE